MRQLETRSEIASDIHDRWDSLVKPPGSLGDLEDWVVTLGEIQRTQTPEVAPASLLLFAGDHGVTEEDVSAYPSSVTARMLETIQDGGAAINELCEKAGMELRWFNVGSESALVQNGEKIADGTENMLRTRAIPESEVREAVTFGRDVLEEASANHQRLIGLGEIGIGNTTASSAVAGAILEDSFEAIVGPGTGVHGQQLEHKRQVVEEILGFHDVDPGDGYDVLSAVGGYELAAQTGVILEASERNMPVLLDGFITAAAALVAERIEPRSTRVLIASHQSNEPGHELILDELGLEPMVDFNLRLGEGSGAALVYPMLESAVAVYHGMKTFEEAGVTVATP